MTVRSIPLLVAALLVVGCGDTSTTGTSSTPTTTIPTTESVATEPVTTEPVATEPVTTEPVTTEPVTVDTVATDVDGIVNLWVGPAADLTALPLGTDFVSTTAAAVGGLYVCDGGDPNGGGAFAVGPWIDEAAGTWDITQKISVQGEVEWPMATYTETVDGSSRSISSNGLPVGMVSGEFPIAADDPAYAYDRNPNSIAETDISVTLPVAPEVADEPSCLPKGTIGVAKNGVALFAPVDAMNRDAVAYETQDECDGHPQQSSTYHYHDVPSCLQSAASGSSTVVGYALDGFPIVVERNAAGELPTNADLDECHGRVSPIELDGTEVEMYHYSVTAEFPYFIGCYRGAAVA